MPSSLRVDSSSDNEDIKSTNAYHQAPLSTAAVGARLRARAEKLDLKAADLCRIADIKPQTMSGYWKGDRTIPSDKLFAIADALQCSARWLVSGVEGIGAGLRSADDAEWVDVPEYDLRELTDEGPGPVVSTTPIRKDWLNRTLLQSKGLWLARLPSDLPRLGLNQGDLVFLRDIEPGEVQDGAVYIVRVDHHLTVARIDTMLGNRMNSMETNLQDRAIAPRDIGVGDGKVELIARVLGAPLRRL